LIKFHHYILYICKKIADMNAKQCFRIGLIIAILLVICSPYLDAQCPMCKMAVESNLKGGGNAGRGLNAGILYMLATPYLLVGGLAFVWWRNRRKNADQE
jgi:hypothetical protein